MNFLTNLRKQTTKKQIRQLVLTGITTFLLSGCAADQNKDKAVINNLKNGFSTTEKLVLDKKTGVPVLLFHKFMDSSKDIKNPDTEITLDYFKNVLEYLKANGYSTISYEQLYSYIKDGTPIPKNSIVLSIDDGFYADGAIKLLKQYNMHADLAVVGERDEKGKITDPTDYYSWEQINTLAQDKDGDIIDVIDHTPQHVDLEELSKSPDELNQLFKSSMSIFKQELGSSSDILVYPYGTYNQQIEETASQAGYKMGITADEGLNYYGDNPFEIKRYIVTENVSIEEMFKHIESGSLSKDRDEESSDSESYIDEDDDNRNSDDESNECRNCHDEIHDSNSDIDKSEDSKSYIDESNDINIDENSDDESSIDESVDTNDINSNIDESIDTNDKLVLDKGIGVPVLLFHKFMGSPSDIKNPDTEISIGYFKNILDYLKANEYSTISLQQLYSYVKEGTPIPQNSIVLSIDDGFYVDGAVNLLKQYNMHADLAVVGERDEKGIITDPNAYYSWEQIISLAQDKDGDIIDVTDHTPQHADLVESSKSPDALNQLLKSSMNIFKQELGSSSDILVYPYGTYNQQIEAAAAQAGYKMGVTVDEGLNYYGDNPFEIKRYMVIESVSIEEMFGKINSAKSNRGK